MAGAVCAALGLAAQSFRGPASGAATAPRVPRKPRRLEFRFILISPSLFFRYCSNAINLDQRVSRKCRDCNCGARRTTVWKISFENIVHAIVVLDFREKHAQLE